VLPLLPGLAASSPIAEGKVTGMLDTRLRVYRDNQRKLGSIIGKVIPESVSNAQEYEEQILRPIYNEIAPLDPNGILQHDWLNFRGAAAHFDRGSIQIRLLDIQETPPADLAIVRLVAETVRALAEERWVPLQELDRLSTGMLASLLDEAITHGEHFVLKSESLLRALGYEGHQATLRELWTHLTETLVIEQGTVQELEPALLMILRKGTLATRILAAVGPNPSVGKIREVYARLADCALQGMMFEA
jgi:carboxylate-amine ligase